MKTVVKLASDSADFERLIVRFLVADEGSVRLDRIPADPSVAWLHPEWERQHAARASAWLVRLSSVDTSRLTEPQRIDWLALTAQLKHQVVDTGLRYWRRNPGRYLTIRDISWRVAGDPRSADWNAVLGELQTVPLALAMGRSLLSEPPPLWIRRTVRAAHSYCDFLRGELRERAAAALGEYATFLSDTLRSGSENSWMVGRDYYDWVLREVNLLPFTADSLIAAGRRLHEATKRALDSLASELRPGASWRVLAEEMRGRHPEPGQMTSAYESESRRATALLIRDDLVTLPPPLELVFVASPMSLRQATAWAEYGGIEWRGRTSVGRVLVTDVAPGITDGERRETLRSQNNGWIAVVASHEGYPGHHLQYVYATRNTRPLRRWLWNTYFTEGWALYVEHWMARAGLFDTPDRRLAQLQMKLWRTARAIIDPSLHTGAMTHEQAVQFLVDEVGLERSAAATDVDRFTLQPTRAPSYIIGWLEIEHLKEDVQALHGAGFSEKLFVERVLKAGPLPLALLRRAVLHAYESDQDPTRH